MHNTSAALSDFSAMPRQSSFSTEDLIACGEGELFGPNTPRMPIGAMRMVDRISWISGKGGAYDHGEVRAELDINPSVVVFSRVTFAAIRSCPVASASTPCGS
jgi:3-hydroxyacyl-[acyl-carrier protein] dehydratase/trans-2-decenoyl-[acyl-carrier protein] isomerase